MTNFIDISDPSVHVATPLHRILEARSRVVRCALAPAAESTPPPTPACLGRLPAAIGSAFSFRTRLPSPALYLLRDATAFFHFALSLDGAIVFGSDFSPSFYVEEAKRLLAHLDRLPRPRPEETFSDPVYLPWLWKYHEYGHFLTEMVPRVLIVNELYGLGLSFPVLIPEKPKYVQDAVRALAPDLELQLIDDYSVTINCRCCLVPTPGSFDHAFHPHTRDLMRSAVSRLVANTPDEPARLPSRRLFLSRAEFRRARGTDFRLLANEDELREVAVAYGLEAVEPQLLPLGEQVRLLSTAGVVVGEASSALHNTLFSGSIEVLSLGWINDVQTMIAGLQAQHLTYLLPDNFNDTPDYSREPLGAMDASRVFTIDAAVFESELAEVLRRAEDLV